ncbi:MAG: hydrogenase formation protein HypD [Candidatus Obscuribacterales bacterium]|nr:hydrogenase formation protein HypD [Candidatus Obscuribacterales bacterium]
MKYVNEFRQLEIAQRLAEKISRATTKPWKIMEVCGGQTHTILQYGIEDLLPDSIELLHGPGCPVCVTPVELIDTAVAIAKRSEVILCSYGDMLRVPGSECDLLSARAAGADVRTVYSPLDALAIAQKYHDRKVVFFAVGFETTAPANAMAARQAKRLGLSNFSLLCSHVAVPPVMESILGSPDNLIQAFIGPGHVCCITGVEEYELLSEKYNIPIVIAGFEPLDIMNAVWQCVRQLESGQACVQNEYSRAVKRKGNAPAMSILSEVFAISDKNWRGLGVVPASGFRMNDGYAEFDAERIFGLSRQTVQDSSVCISGQILKGLKKPYECPEFGRQCTPETPLGATMVSSEGTCANYYKFGKFQPKKLCDGAAEITSV